MEFERATFEEPLEPSILKDVSISYALDHYRHLVMSRYPSELDDLMRSVIPTSKRCAHKVEFDKGNGVLLFYHYLLHGFRSNDIRLLNVVETEDERIATHRVWMTYLQLNTHEVEVCTYDEIQRHTKQHYFDAVVMNHYNPERSSEEHLENVWSYVLFMLQTVKPFGFVSIEGIEPGHVHHLHSVLSILYMYRDLCDTHVFVPLQSSETTTYSVIVRRTYTDRLIPESCAPLFHPMMPFGVPGAPSVFVLITSAFKSTNNSNIVPARTRWRQLLHSVRTVRAKIPNAYVVVTDVSPLSETQLDDLRMNGVNEVRVFAQLEGVPKSYCESIVMYRIFSDFLTRKELSFDVAIKLSGRYFLTPSFSLRNTEEVVCKRMRPQEVMTRYIQIPKSLFEKYIRVLQTVTEMPEVQKAEMDIEHALGRTFSEMDDAGARTRKIDVAGFYATNGQMLVE
jgi:hypothetical protein